MTTAEFLNLARQMKHPGSIRRLISLNLSKLTGDEHEVLDVLRTAAKMAEDMERGNADLSHTRRQ